MFFLKFPFYTPSLPILFILFWKKYLHFLRTVCLKSIVVFGKIMYDREVNPEIISRILPCIYVPNFNAHLVLISFKLGVIILQKQHIFCRVSLKTDRSRNWEVSSWNVRLYQLQTEKHQVVTEKCHLGSEKCQLETKKCHLETQKCHLETQKCPLETQKCHVGSKECKNVNEKSLK